MPRFIDADALREEWLLGGRNAQNMHIWCSNDFLESIDAQPTVDAVPPVVHGQWEEHDGKTWCSECNQSNKAYKPPYCPHCGAKMDGEPADDTEKQS
jgi:uncharacterized paraquat-inducible protein A